MYFKKISDEDDLASFFMNPYYAINKDKTNRFFQQKKKNMLKNILMIWRITELNNKMMVLKNRIFIV